MNVVPLKWALKVAPNAVSQFKQVGVIQSLNKLTLSLTCSSTAELGRSSNIFN